MSRKVKEAKKEIDEIKRLIKLAWEYKVPFARNENERYFYDVNSRGIQYHFIFKDVIDSTLEVYVTFGSKKILIGSGVEEMNWFNLSRSAKNMFSFVIGRLKKDIAVNV